MTAILYMLQSTEFKLDQYIAWFNRTSDFRSVMKRRHLEVTRKISLLRIALWSIWVVFEVIAAACIYVAIITQSWLWGLAALAIIIALPLFIGYGVVVPLFIGRVLIQTPREKSIISAAEHIFKQSKAVHIAVVGSYGKTTAKEILLSVISAGLKTAATPGNMNTAIGISRFAQKLKGDEEVLIIEFGEERVGDVAMLSRLSRPTTAVITGINEAHLSSFKSLSHTTRTIYEVRDYLPQGAAVYANGENRIVHKHASTTDHLYDRHGVDGWKVSKATSDLHGTRFTATRGKKVIEVHTKLIGLHTVGVTVMAIAIADSLGMTVSQIEKGIARITPFEHRMQPRQLHGAWIIDDTYNGNSDGVTAGLALLQATDAKRRVYVTPGLVEQAGKTEEVHVTIGTQAATSADVVVLMKNSVTDYIVKGLETGKFKGELVVIDDPLEFYTHLEHFIAAGDVVLMQNDWTDNYA